MVQAALDSSPMPKCFGSPTVLRHEQGRQAAEAFRLRVRASEYTENAGRRDGSVRVDSFDASVRVRRRHDDAVSLARQNDVLSIATASCYEALIFNAPHRLPNPELIHGFIARCAKGLVS